MSRIFLNRNEFRPKSRPKRWPNPDPTAPAERREHGWGCGCGGCCCCCHSPRIELVDDGLEADDGEQPGGESHDPGQRQHHEHDQRLGAGRIHERGGRLACPSRNNPSTCHLAAAAVHQCDLLLLLLLLLLDWIGLDWISDDPFLTDLCCVNHTDRRTDRQTDRHFFGSPECRDFKGSKKKAFSH